MAEQTPSTRTLPRSRGVASGILLVLLGAWGALAPFIGPSFNFAYTPDKTWHWTAARGWYEVLPGSVAFVGGLILLFARGRGITLIGAWLGILAGAWFVAGPPLSTELTLGSIGQPIGTSSGQRTGEILGLFTGLGAVIIFLAATAFGRLSVVTVRDMRHAERREAERVEAEELAAREQAEREQGDRERWEHEQANRDGWDRERTDHGGVAPGIAHEPYDQHADQNAAQHTDQNAADQTAELPRTEQGQHNQGFHSALGYRDGEQPEPYNSPRYGRHDANVRGPMGENSTADEQSGEQVGHGQTTRTTQSGTTGDDPRDTGASNTSSSTATSTTPEDGTTTGTTTGTTGTSADTTPRQAR